MKLDVAPVERSLSARTMHDNLVCVIEEIDRLRLVQQQERPPTKPPWWNEHVHSLDLEWPAHMRSNCRSHRMAFRHRRTEQIINRLLSGFTRLADGIELSPAHRSALHDTANSLDAMKVMLSGAQPCARLYWAVIPDQTQLRTSIPSVYTPVLQTDHERWIQDEICSICFRYAHLGEGEPEANRKLIRLLTRRSERLQRERVRQNRRLLLTMVTQEQHDRVVALFADWREIAGRWDLAENGVRRAVQILSMGEQAAAPAPFASLPHVPELDEALSRIVQAAVDEAVRTVRSQPELTRKCSCGRAGRYQITMEGSSWVLVFDGRRTILKNGAGMVYLRRLVQFPGRHVSFSDLAKESTPAEVLDRRSEAEPIDLEAARAYHIRLVELDKGLDSARKDCDAGKIDRLELEKAALTAQIGSAFRRGHFQKGGLEYRRMRNRITGAVNRAVDEIEGDNSAAGVHLRQSFRTDLGMVYRPAVPLPWEF